MTAKVPAIVGLYDPTGTLRGVAYCATEVVDGVVMVHTVPVPDGWVLKVPLPQRVAWPTLETPLSTAVRAVLVAADLARPGTVPDPIAMELVELRAALVAYDASH